MRLWLVNPRLMCNQHLLGEHVECHMFVGIIRLGQKIDGYHHLVETALIESRHNELAQEMIRRGMNHNSRLEYMDCLRFGSVDRAASLIELRRRCSACRELAISTA
jgi:hypothetical protein